MKDRDFVQAVRDRVATVETWCKRSYFRDTMGRSIWDESEYPNAVAWTVGGAAQAVSGYKSGATMRLAKLLGFDGHQYPVNKMNDWNDSIDHKTVLKKLDETIARLS